MDMFKSVIELKGLKANEHFQNLLACLKEHNLLYTVANIHPKFFLTHSANRGGLLLSPHNVHRNAARIRKCGADTKQLTNALAIEVAASGMVREQHVAQNDMLIKRAGGLLAPINGCERLVTLGCGHTVAFCKLAGLSGRTCEPELRCADSDTIDLHKLCKNK